MLALLALLTGAPATLPQVWSPAEPIVVRIRDSDGDAIDDLAVSVRPFDRTDVCDVVVRSGASGCVLWTRRIAPDERAVSVKSLADAGDVDRDGRSDLALAVKRVLNRPKKRGAVALPEAWIEILSGEDGSLLRTFPVRTHEGQDPRLAGGSDFDGDGFSDLALAVRADDDAGLVVRSGADGAELARWSWEHLAALLPRDDAAADLCVRQIELGWLPPSEAGSTAELLVAWPAGLVVLRVDGQVRTTRAHPGQQPLAEPLGDLSYDGVSELAAGFVILDGATLGVHAVSSHLPVFPWSACIHSLSSVPIGDVDGDGARDYARVACDTLGLQGGWVEVRSSRTDAVLWLNSSVPSIAGPNDEVEGFELAELPDLDEDGAQDFVTLGLATGALVARSGRNPARVLWRS